MILERSLKRLEWEKAREREEKEAADAAEKERIAMQMIDWCDWILAADPALMGEFYAQGYWPLMHQSMLILFPNCRYGIWTGMTLL